MWMSSFLYCKWASRMWCGARAQTACRGQCAAARSTPRSHEPPCSSSSPADMEQICVPRKTGLTASQASKRPYAVDDGEAASSVSTKDTSRSIHTSCSSMSL